MQKIKDLCDTIFPSIDGWCAVEKAGVMIDLVEETTPSLILELGVFAGKSLLPLALASKKMNPSAKVIGIDAWAPQASLEGVNSPANDDWWSKLDYNLIYNRATELMKFHKISDIVELWKMRTVDVADKFQDHSIDILHQDSNHSEEVSCAEVELYWNKVKPGGYWVFDDTNWGTTKKAQELLLSKGYQVFVVQKENLWRVYKKNKT